MGWLQDADWLGATHVQLTALLVVVVGLFVPSVWRLVATVHAECRERGRPDWSRAPLMPSGIALVALGSLLHVMFWSAWRADGGAWRGTLEAWMWLPAAARALQVLGYWLHLLTALQFGGRLSAITIGASAAVLVALGLAGAVP